MIRDIDTLGGLSSIQWGIERGHVSVEEVWPGDEPSDPNSSDYYIVRTCDGGGALYDDIGNICADRGRSCTHALHVWEHQLPDWLTRILAQ
jgi:hypothetical protein